MPTVHELAPSAVDGGLLRDGPLLGTELYSAPQPTAAFPREPWFPSEGHRARPWMQHSFRKPAPRFRRTAL
jgi:hypothetical protein